MRLTEMLCCVAGTTTLDRECEVIWQGNSKSISQIDSTWIIHFFSGAVSEIWQVTFFFYTIKNVIGSFYNEKGMLLASFMNK